MWAMMPMLRVLSNGYCRSTAFASSFSDGRRGGSACGPPRRVMSLPAVVRERLVGLRHPVRVFSLLDGGAPVVGRVQELAGQLLRHALLPPAAGGGGGGPPWERGPGRRGPPPPPPAPPHLARRSARFRRFGAVLRAALFAVGHAGRVQNPPNDVIPDPRKVLHPAAPDQDDRVLLEVMTDPRDVRGHLEPVGQPDARHLAKRRVGLLRRRRVHPAADPPFLRASAHGRGLGLLYDRLPALPA